MLFQDKRLAGITGVRWSAGPKKWADSDEVRTVSYRRSKKKIRTVQSEQKKRKIEAKSQLLQSKACAPSLPGKQLRLWKKTMKGSLTVEAAICLPIVLFLCVLLLQPLQAMGEQRQLQNRMEAVAKDAALAAYTGTLAAEQRNPDIADGGEGQAVMDALAGGAIRAQVLTGKTEKALKNVRFTTLKLPQEETDGMVQLELDYDLKLPFSLFRLPAVHMSSVVSRRAWIGSAGGRGRARYGQGSHSDGFDLDEAGNRLVYVGKGGSRYHKDRHCHYIDNQMKPVPAESVKTLKNSAGRHYQACASCKPGHTGTVYIFPEGTSYHAGQDCKAIGSYAQVYKLEEVAYLGPCSYCSKG